MPAAPHFGAWLAWVSLLIAACVLGPFAAAVFVSPWLGVVLALAAMRAWGKFGPRPFPGFLQGCLFLFGSMAVLYALVLCAALAASDLRDWALRRAP